MDINQLNKKYNCSLYIVEFENIKNSISNIEGNIIIVKNPFSIKNDESIKISSVIPVDGNNAWEVTKQEFEQIEYDNSYAPPNGCIGIAFATASATINNNAVYVVWNPSNCKKIDLTA